MRATVAPTPAATAKAKSAPAPYTSTLAGNESPLNHSSIVGSQATTRLLIEEPWIFDSLALRVLLRIESVIDEV
jgi:hypothetical protein